jgi:hypothetical protein
MKSMLLTLAATLAATSSAAQAANARHPYANIDHRIDAGNDTGDAQVEALNEGQLRGASRDWTGSGRWVPGLATIYSGHSQLPLSYSRPVAQPPQWGATWPQAYAVPPYYPRGY